MVEADIHLRPFHTSILDIYKVFGPLECCFKGIWLHPYTVTLARLAPDLVCLMEANISILQIYVLKACPAQGQTLDVYQKPVY